MADNLKDKAQFLIATSGQKSHFVPNSRIDSHGI
jgi:hypothetical protein